MTTNNNINAETTTSAKKPYPCPRCQQKTTWQNNPFKPFCSQRCKLIDLGAWASEDYKIASVEDELFTNDLNSNQ